ncbi:DUF1016 N-terminal domain-containing protein [Clostridium tagluense]|uniref:DUF1016 N-terminal domain-containing protein n=1 Tax=Clostridium tagluense TaxID=360422 RepID=UPI003898D9AB
MDDNLKPYNQLFKNIKIQILSSRNKALRAVNREMIELYWNIGNIILRNQEKEGWGTKIIGNLSKDIKNEFTDLKGFSERNLKYMRKFAEQYDNAEFVQQVVAQIPWAHNLVIMEKIKDIQERIWYINKTVENGWSRNILAHQIEIKMLCCY